MAGMAEHPASVRVAVTTRLEWVCVKCGMIRSDARATCPCGEWLAIPKPKGEPKP